jgi:hypothetical protein
MIFWNIFQKNTKIHINNKVLLLSFEHWKKKVQGSIVKFSKQVLCEFISNSRHVTLSYNSFNTLFDLLQNNSTKLVLVPFMDEMEHW